MKTVWLAGCILSVCAAPAFAQGMVPPDYNPQTATQAYSNNGAVPPDYYPPAPSQASPSEGVPPDYNPQTAPNVTSASSVPPDYRPSSAMQASGLRPDLKPRAGQLSQEEQLDLLKRNEADIAAKREAQATLSARQAEQYRAAQEEENARRQAAAQKRRTYQRDIHDSDLEFRAKLNKARAQRANEYVDAELEAMKRGAPSPIR